MAKKKVEETEIKPDKKVKAKKVSKKPKFNKLKKIELTLGRKIILGAILAIVILIGVIGYLIYGARNESKTIQGISAILPFPAEIIGGGYVTANDYLTHLETRKKYYQEFKKVDFNSEDGKKLLNEQRNSVLDRLAEDAIVEREAQVQKIKLDKKEINTEYDRLIVSNSGQEGFSEALKKYYGLTIDEYKKKIFIPSFLRQKLTEKINDQEDETGAAKKKAEEILAKLKAGADFAKMATENSQDEESATKGGDVGFFGKGKMVPEFEKAAFEAKEGDIVGPVKTTYGYHIIKVTGKKGEEVKASHILIKTRDFNEWLAEKKTELKNKKYLGFIPAYWVMIKVK